MNILFLYPNLYGMNTLPPAIGTFTALLNQNGHKLALFDTSNYKQLIAVDSDKQKAENLNARDFDDAIFRKNIKTSNATDDFVAAVKRFSPDLIAMSATEDTFPVGVKLLSALRVSKPLVVCGGVFPTFAPELAWQYSKGSIDYILRGEGDDTLIEFCRRLDNATNLSSLEGLYTEKNGKILNNKLPSPTDLSTLPLPDYSLFDDNRFYRPMHGKLRKMLPVTTIRGCPFNCRYCNSPAQRKIFAAEGHTFLRKRQIDLVKQEIEHVINSYKADSIYFWADTFLAWTDKEFEEFCEMYSEFRLPFWVQTRPETVKEWKFKKLQELGLLRVAFGIEHGNDKFRQEMLARNIKNSTIIKNLNIVTNLGIPISVNNIIGFPTETRELVFDTIELNRNIRSDGINAYTYTPFHGTSLRKVSENLGYFDKGRLARCINNSTLLNMPHFPAEEIEGLRRCFVLYSKMPRSKWKEIEKAEKATPAGERMFEKLKTECLNKHMHYGDHEEE